jgi:hypothetical protein
MTCIDAAIIKALVEHIGMNPDEIPTGGASSGTYTGEVLEIPAEFNPFRIKKEDMPEYGLKVGSILKLNFQNNIRLTFLLTSVIDNSSTNSKTYYFTAGDMEANLTLQTSGTHSGYYLFAFLGGWSIELLQEGYEIIQFNLDYNDNRPLPAYYTLLLMSSLRTIIRDVHKAMNN